MARKTEYVTYYGNDVSQHALGEADVDGNRNKRQVDKEIKEEMSGQNNGTYRLLVVRKYTWVGSDGWWDLYDDEEYWYNPNLSDDDEETVTKCKKNRDWRNGE